MEEVGAELEFVGIIIVILSNMVGRGWGLGLEGGEEMFAEVFLERCTMYGHYTNCWHNFGTDGIHTILAPAVVRFIFWKMSRSHLAHSFDV